MPLSRSLAVRSFPFAVALGVCCAQSLAQVGIDGVIGAEWSGPGVTVRTVTYDVSAPVSNFGTPGTTNHTVAYKTYFRADSSYVYAAVAADPGSGVAPGGYYQFANLYFSTMAPSNGSIAMEVNNNRFFRGGVPGYTDATGYAFWSSNSVDGVIEVAISIDFLKNDPLGMGFATATNKLRFNLSQSFGYSVAGGTDYNEMGGPDERLGIVDIPAPAPACVAAIVGIGAFRRKRR